MPAEWGSDVVVDMMKAYGMKYMPLNLGGTYRGLLDSLVNYGGNKDPEVIECLQEEIAVSVAFGYARATGRLTPTAVHNVVGTMHAAMAIYESWVGRTPVMVFSGTGPMSMPERRPWIDWVHTALVQGNLVRDYVKWDDQPHDPESVPESFMRAYRAAMTEPRGPVYLALDAGWQEAQLEQPVPIPDIAKFMPPTGVQGDPAALKEVARLIAQAELPIIITDRLGRNPNAVASLIALAEAGAIPVMDLGGAMNFPNTHPMDVTGTNVLEQADLIIMLDVDQPEVSLVARERYPRGRGRSRVKAGAKVIAIGLSDLLIRSTTVDFGSLYPFDLNVTADSSLALPVITEELRSQVNSSTLEKRTALVRERKDAAKKRWTEEAKKEFGHTPISHARIAQETWNAIKGDHWLVQGNLEGWVRRLWQVDRPGCVIGGGGAAGLGTGLSRAVGVALAARDEGGYGVAFNGDGEWLYDSNCLWTAVHHKIPLLAVIIDNGGYIGEGGHVEYVSRQRERSLENAHIAVHIQNPRVDFAGLARAQGAWAEAVEDPNKLGDAIQRAVKVVKEESTAALISVRTA